MTTPLPTSPFAIWRDLAERWRPIVAAEQTRVTTLLEDAATVIRAYIPGIDVRIAAGEVPAGAALMVSCRMVRRALEQGPMGASQVQNGPFMRQFSNPEGNLYILPEEFRILGRSTNKSPLFQMPPPGGDPYRRHYDGWWPYGTPRLP